jgi:hypothetical protein
MKKEKWFWIFGWALFLLSSMVVAFTNISRYGFHNRVTMGFTIMRSLEVTGSLLLVLLVLVLSKSVTAKVWLIKYKLDFWSLFREFLSITLFDLFFCLILVWWFIRVFFWKSGQDMVYISGLFLYFVFEFFLSRNFLMKLNKKIKRGLKWSLSVLGMIVVSHLLFAFIYLILMKI